MTWHFFQQWRGIAFILVTSFFLAGCSLNQTLSKVPGISALLALPDEYFAVADDETLTDAEYKIVYSDLGFQPVELTIRPNTRVVFFNNSAASAWIRSSQPWYSLEPTFDQEEGMDGGEWLSIIFKQEGEWVFENYLNPDQTGKIIVEE